MLQINKILFPTDFSEAAHGALTHALHLTRQHDAKLYVLNVVAPEKGTGLEKAEAAADPTTLMATRLQVSEPDIVDVAPVYARNQASSEADGILRYASDHGIDLIVMGTNGRRGIDRLLMGSVAEEVVQQAECPVFTVRFGGERAGQDAHRRILVPVDFSEYGEPALGYARELAEFYGAHLDLLHVVEEDGFRLLYGTRPRAVAASEVKAQNRQVLEEYARREHIQVPYSVHALIGNPNLDIVDYARLHDIDLIVIATHGRTGLQRLRMGSVAEKVVRHAPCPVFTVKSFGKSLLAPVSASNLETEGEVS